ncbi:TniQ family protein [Luteimonas sp. SMYT11W]|uniref:TniQ family protein n=1 Tax=Luteimonas flava TaxID=3115822 RepID=A0ABU7WF14_9GAMM
MRKGTFALDPTIDAVQPLVVTPPPDPRENYLGYAMRLSAANGYTSPTVVFPSSDHLQRQTFQHDVYAQTFATLACLSSAQTDRLSLLMSSGTSSMRSARFCGRDLAFYHHKVCVACLKSDGIFDASWHLTLMTHCPIHRTRLTGVCASCGLSLKIRRRLALLCKCKQELVGDTSAECSPARAQLFALMRASFLRLPPMAPPPENLACFAEVPPADVMMLVKRMADFVDRSRHPTVLCPHQGMDAKLEAVAQAFDQWHLGYPRMHGCLTHYDPPGRRRPLSDYSWFAASSLHKESNWGALEFIRHKLLPHVSNGKPERVNLHQNSGSEDLVSLDAAAALLGVEPARIETMVARGIGFRRHHCLKQRTRWIDRSQMDLSKRSSEAGLTAEQAAQLIDMSPELFERLARSEIYRGRHVTTTGGLYASEDVNCLQKRLRAIGHLRIGPGRGTAISQIGHKCTVTQLNLAAKLKRALCEHQALIAM